LRGNERAGAAFVVSKTVIFANDFVAFNPAETDGCPSMDAQIPGRVHLPVGEPIKRDSLIEQTHGQR
jgi:hypothetical protein